MLDSFLKFLTYERRYSPHTIAAYRHDLEQFQEFIASTYPELKIEEVSHTELRGWVVSLMQSGLDSRSVNRKMASLRSFFKFLLKREKIAKDPTWKLKALKVSKKLPSFAQEDHMGQLLDNFPFSEDYTGWRDRITLELLYGTGMRRAELIGLKEDDLNLSQQTIRVLGKRNKERVIPISRQIVHLLESYLEVKKSVFGSNVAPNLIVNNNGKAAYPMLIERIVKKYLQMIPALDKRSPHVLRHSYATHLLNKGADLNAVKELLGHSSLAATQVYTHNSLDKLKNVFDQAHPKA